jgi:Beta-propeller repeat
MKKVLLIIICFFTIECILAQDAVFSWSKGMGSTGSEISYGIKTDAAGNVYTCGTYIGTVDFDPGLGVVNLTSNANGSTDGFIQKIDPGGNLIWVKRFGSPSSPFGSAFGSVTPQSIEIDASGNIYTVGKLFAVIDFDPGVGEVILSVTGTAGFISKLDVNGNYVWVKRIEGTNSMDNVSITSLKLDDTGNNLLFGGFFNGFIVDFDPGAGSTILQKSGTLRDMFVEKLTDAGNFVWVKQLGGSGNDGTIKAITIDAAGNIITTGSFKGTADFDPNASSALLTSANFTDAFVSKLNTNGDFMWAKQLGGSMANDESTGVAVDATNNVYTTGSFKLNADFDPGAGISMLTSAGGSDVFVSKLNVDGTFNWVKGIGSTLEDSATSISIANNMLYYTGTFNGTVDFDPGAGTTNLAGAGGNDIFISKLLSDGSFGWAKRIGTNTYEKSTAIHADAAENIYTTGLFSQTCDFDPGVGVFNLTTASGADIFIQKMTKEVPTPVKLLSFTATAKNCGEINLTWTTANEQNNKGFYVEQSNDGRVYKHVDFVAAKPQSDNQYQVSLKGLLPEKYYYRLKQIDKDGAFEYFNVISTTLNCGKSGISIYPTLANNLLHIDGLNNQYKGKIYIYDMHGKLCILSDVSGTNATINVQQLVAGSYMLSANGQRFRFIKSGQ